jgi:mono/diheme cytochrome c family protein
MKRKITLALALLMALFINKAFCQEWIVPQDQVSIKNPSVYNRQNVKDGKAIFMTNCKSCHGDPGKYNGLALVPPPPDITSEKMLSNTEGALFYKITHGRAAMPSFEKTLSEEQRWKVIIFFKKFDPVNAGIKVDDEPIKAKLQGSVDEGTSLISVSAQAENQTGTFGPLQGADVLVKVKKLFGTIQVGKTVTNAQGYAEYAFPKSYIGDAEGKLDLELSLSDDYASNIVALNRAKICTPNDPENLFKEKVLWSTNDKTQIWLIMTYIFTVTGVWAVIGYIIFLLIKIKNAGNK